MKKRLLYLLIPVIVLLTGYVINESGTEKYKTKIGAVIPQSGFGAYWGQAVMKGAEMAKQDLKRLYNIDVQIIYEDSQGSPKPGTSAASKLINTDKVDVLYTEFSGVSSAVSPIANTKGIPLVYSSFNQKIVEDNQSSFKTFIDYENICEEFARTVSPNAKVLILASIGDAAPFCEKGFKEISKDIEIVSLEGLVGNDFRTVLLKQSKDFSPDYILPIMYEDGNSAVIKQKNELNLPGKIVCYVHDCKTEKIVDDLPNKYFDDVITFGTDIKPAFIEALKKEYPTLKDSEISGAANAYQSILMIGRATRKCQKSSTCIVNNMESMYSVYEGATIENRMLKSNITFK